MIEKATDKMSVRTASARLVFAQDMALSLLGSLLAVLVVRWLSDPIPSFVSHLVQWLLSGLVGIVAGLLISGSWKAVRNYMTLKAAAKAAYATLIKGVVLTLALLFGIVRMPSPALATTALLLDLGFTGFFTLYLWYIISALSHDERTVRRNAAKKTALVVGTGLDSIEMAEENAGEFDVIGYLTTDLSMGGRTLGERVVYYCADQTEINQLQWRLGGIDCILFPKGAHLENGQKSGDAADEVPQGDAMSLAGHAVKRLFDITLSALLLVIFSPVMLLCALAIRLEDGEPVIYRQERIGRGGKPFDILKFRSMRKDAENGSPALWSGEDDPRLTKVGRFLRRHHLDELPQLWNVFRGDMSFIGYRPERQYYIEQIMERNPRYRYLYQIRPGVTSYATLYNGYTDTLQKMLTRLDLDLYYLRNHSVMFDLKVLGLTFLGIVSGRKF